MPAFVVHPTARILLWVLVLLAIQCLNGGLLAAAFLGLLPLSRTALRRGGRLIWRSRWLIVSLFLVFAWGVAGEPVWAVGASPTYEGFYEAFLHLGRLLLVLMAIAAFLDAMPVPELLGGARQLLAPFKRYGCNPDRAVIRLMLVLHYVEMLPRPRDWRTLLNAPALAAGNRNDSVDVDSRPLHLADYALLTIAAASCLTLFLIV